ncbi:hypothetical protein ACFQZR_19610 [Paenibacillus sp. GCM10027629]|uniref:hypothetical protein n=1 Tax=Paenibacillus sp. GCM10027629 TaxID=3273414 RepID=UPI00363B4E7D
MYFTAEERRGIIRSLSKAQRNALHIFSRLSQQSYFANVLASYKGTDRFIFDGFIDHGEVIKGVTCLCGKSLRYEFILKDIKSGQKNSLGRTHFQRELDIPDHIARQVHKGIHHINIELDEILDKYWRNDKKVPQSISEHIINIKLPEEIKCLLNAELPLLRRHIDYLFDETKKFRTTSVKNVDDKILCQEFQDILSNKKPYYEYIDGLYGDAIEKYMTTNPYYYTSTHEIINFLIENKGLKKQLLYGQHPLHKFFREYLSQHPLYLPRHEDYRINYDEIKHIVNMSLREIKGLLRHRNDKINGKVINYFKGEPHTKGNLAVIELCEKYKCESTNQKRRQL